MKYRMYSVLDRKARNYGNPMAFLNDDIARRGATTLLRDNNSEISQFPDDFDLYYIGDFSTEHGVIVPSEVPQLVFCFGDLDSAVSASNAAFVNGRA